MIQSFIEIENEKRDGTRLAEPRRYVNFGGVERP